MKNNSSVIFLVLVLFFSCKENSKDFYFHSINSTKISNSDLEKQKLIACVFLAPGCPLSEASLLELNKLDSLYHQYNYNTYVIIPGNLYSEEEIKSFKDSFTISFPIIIDTNYYLCSKLNASITPEYFLLKENMVVLYQGAIDNRALDNDVIRQSASINFADSAINSYLQNKKIEINKTNAVGCYIER
jgi:Redoxin